MPSLAEGYVSCLLNDMSALTDDDQVNGSVLVSLTSAKTRRLRQLLDSWDTTWSASYTDFPGAYGIITVLGLIHVCYCTLLAL